MTSREILTLKPKSPKGQKLIDLYGDKWEVINHLPMVRCLGNRAGALIQAKRSSYQIWMVLPDIEDHNFTIL